MNTDKNNLIPYLIRVHPRSSAANGSSRSPQPRRLGHTARHRGVSLIELLLALSITALLLTATMVATNASFRAYADAAEQASAQASARMVTTRLLALVRTSTAHGPLEPGTGVTLDGNTLTSNYIELEDPSGAFQKITYNATSQELSLTVTPAGGGEAHTQPLMSGVKNAVFSLVRREDSDGIWVLARGTMDLTIEPGHDATLAIESGHTSDIRVIASTMPRKLAD